MLWTCRRCDNDPPKFLPTSNLEPTWIVVPSYLVSSHCSIGYPYVFSKCHILLSQCFLSVIILSLWVLVLSYPKDRSRRIFSWLSNSLYPLSNTRIKAKKSTFLSKSALQDGEELPPCWAHSFEMNNCTLVERTPSCSANAPSLEHTPSTWILAPFQTHACTFLVACGRTPRKEESISLLLTNSSIHWKVASMHGIDLHVISL